MKAALCIKAWRKYPRCHAPSICELLDGDLLACCFAGQEKEGTPEQVIAGARFDRRRKTRSKPQVWVHVPRRAAGNPKVFRAPVEGETWLIAPMTYGQWCSGGTMLFMKRPRDGGRSWTDLEILCEEKGILGKNKPLVEGSFCLVPVEQEHLGNPRFLRSEDAGVTWELPGSGTPLRPHGRIRHLGTADSAAGGVVDRRGEELAAPVDPRGGTGGLLLPFPLSGLRRIDPRGLHAPAHEYPSCAAPGGGNPRSAAGPRRIGRLGPPIARS